LTARDNIESIGHTAYNTDHAIYHHSLYQRLAAEGCKMEYGIYSLGIALGEIAL
jgi:hypothetical protein